MYGITVALEAPDSLITRTLYDLNIHLIYISSVEKHFSSCTFINIHEQH